MCSGCAGLLTYGWGADLELQKTILTPVWRFGAHYRQTDMKGEVGKITDKTYNLNHSIPKPVLEREKFILVVWPRFTEFDLNLRNNRKIINAYFPLPII